MIPADEVDWLNSSANLGGDSLVAIEMWNWLACEANVEVFVFDILHALSLVALAGNVFKLIKVKMAIVSLV